MNMLAALRVNRLLTRYPMAMVRKADDVATMKVVALEMAKKDGHLELLGKRQSLYCIHTIHCG